MDFVAVEFLLGWVDETFNMKVITNFIKLLKTSFMKHKLLNVYLLIYFPNKF